MDHAVTEYKIPLMKKRGAFFLIILFLFLIPCSAYSISNQIGFDFTVGGTIMPWEYYFLDTDAYTGYTMEPYYTFSAGITYTFVDWFTLGIWIGYFHNNPYLERAIQEEMYLLSVPLTYGLKLIFGDLNYTVAASINIGVTPSIGLYINNIIVSIFYGGITTTMIKHYENHILVSATEQTDVLIYLEVGYHFALD